MVSGIQCTAPVLRRRSAYTRFLSAACLAVVGITASGSSSTYSLILRPRIELNAFQGVPGNYIYTPVDGVIHDLNSDGAPDIVIGVNGSHPAVYLNNGTADPFANVPGVFVSPPVTSSMIAWGAVAVSDVNNDGHPDLAIAGFNAPNHIYLNDGSATPFNNVSPIAIGTLDVSMHPAFGDVNGDGFVDIAVANTNHVASRVYLTQGAPLTSGTYSVAEVGTATGYGQSVAIADVNGDQRPDLILAYTIAQLGTTDPEGILIYLNDGTGDPFGNVTSIQLLAGQSVMGFKVADVNQDQRMDLIASVANASMGAAVQSVFLNTASATQPFSNAQALLPNDHLGGGCFDIAVADMNADTRPDLLFSCVAPAWNADPVPENPAAGSIYLNSGAANPFANVSPVDIPALRFSGYGRSIDVGTLVANAPPAVLVVNDGTSYGAYYPTVLAQDPVAQNDSAIVAINKTLQIDVLANDTAAPGQTLDTSSLVITERPQHGAATVNASGSLTYTPASGYSGADVFAYTVRDSVGARSQRAVVNIVVQPAPIATNDLRTLGAGQSVILDVLANDTSSGGTLDPASVTIVVQPVNGTATVANGQVVYTPAAGYAGVDAFQYSVKDNLGTVSNVATVSLSVQPAPVATNDSSSVQANGSVTINVVANDKSEKGTLDSASIAIVTGPAHGAASVSNGSVTYIPSAGYSGSDSFQYSVRDNLGVTSNAATVSVQVTAAPSAGGGGGGGGGSFGASELLALLGLVGALAVRRIRCPGG